MIVPPLALLRSVVADAIAQPGASASRVAEAVHDFLTGLLTDGEPCIATGCPTPRVPGLEQCAEHAAQELARLRVAVRAAT